MVLLSLGKQILYPENQFERGHPVQLLLYLFNQFNQESAILLLNDIENLCPDIPKQSLEIIQKADQTFKRAYDQHQYYLTATDEEKEYIELEMKKRNKQTSKKVKKQIKKVKKLQKQRSSSKLQQISEQKETEQDDESNKYWMNAEQFELCHLLYRKAIKISPTCIKSHLKLTRFLFQTNKISAANQIYQTMIKMIETEISAKKGDTPKKTARLRYKSRSSQQSGIHLLDKYKLEKLETLVMFFVAYMYYMQDDIKSFNKLLTQCLEREPKNIGMRCQYVVALTSNMKYEESYDHLEDTLKILDGIEEDSNNNQLIKRYRVICGMGCAAIRCVFSKNWNLVSKHLKNVIENDGSNGIFRYCLSYSLYKAGQFDESNDHYNYFVKYIEKKRAAAEKSKQKKSKTEIDEDTKINAAISELSMNYFKWHPNSHKDNYSEMVDLLVDFVVLISVIFLIYHFFGYKPHFGTTLIDSIVLGCMLGVSCVLCSPSLGMLLMVVSLPPFKEGMDFDYYAFGMKWLCVSAGMLFVHRVVIGGEMPRSKLF